MAELDLLRRFSQKLPWPRLLPEGRAAHGGVSVGGVVGSMLPLLAAAWHQRSAVTVLLELPSEEDAEDAVAELTLHGVSAVHLPGGHAGDLLRLRRVAQVRAPTVVVAACRVLLEGFASREACAAAALRLRCGEAAERDDIVERLSAAGLQRDGVVERPGSYAVRGDLVDFMVEGGESALRAEFSDGKLADLRSFDPATQLSLGVVQQCEILLGAMPEATAALSAVLPAETVVVRGHALACQEAVALHAARLNDEQRAPALARYEQVAALAHWWTSDRELGAEGVDLGGRMVVAEGGGFESAVQTLERVARGKDRVVLAFEAAGEMARFQALLPEALRTSGVIRFCVGRLLAGFQAPALGLAACGHNDLFLTQVRRRRTAAQVSAPAPRTRALESFLELREGDLVVHALQGIARFVGLERVDKDGAAQDHLRLEFADQVMLLVPATRIDLVQKYVGGRGAQPELSRLGGAAWNRRKEQVAASVAELAAGLLEAQALRAARRGQAHAVDTAWQQEFEAAFPHELTGDQQRAMDEIRRDMEQPRPMDRLLCGDVGYGKTELAMRAAFKCAMGGRQSAVLVPTTLLAQQHAEVFRERMAAWPVRIECLSRFRSDREVREILEACATGGVDVLIGTHRLVGPDVRFHDLGLLVIDEEQRFGVGHKEKLRRLRSDVDVLTMTATPIPRTLHQSMLGIRDISPLQEAPRGRREVVTTVGSFDARVVRAAILRELDRRGQVYFVHNRVRSIDSVAARLQELVPEARVLVGHGQMSASELESTMLRFLAGRADVLVATTIVESGIDIPAANTIFVDEAQDYGLADLHQLRGRVGRSHVQAYAWFLVPADRLTGADAQRRLAAIEEFSHLGAGFRIAVRDLEIRGAGNLLGAEQSGHIASVGYEMYCRLLDAAVKRMQKLPPPSDGAAELDLNFHAEFPESWINDRRLRVDAYRRMSRARSAADIDELERGFRDRFGQAPAAALAVADLARVRVLISACGVRRLWLIPGEGVALGCAAAELRRRIAHPQNRVVQGGTLLLVTDEEFTDAAGLLAFLRGALRPLSAANRRG